LSFPLLALNTALTLCPLFLSHTNNVYGALHCSLHLTITTPAQKGFFFLSSKPSQQFTAVEQLDSFDVDVVQNPFLMFLSELSNFTRNHLHLKVPGEVGGPDVPSCVNVVPKYVVLKSMNDVSVGLFRTTPHLYAVGPHRLQYLFVHHHLIMY
jgi:hypothetical protein